MTPEELAAAREVLARADHFGVNTKAGKHGSMNDSSKRLRERDHAQAEADDWEPVTYEETGAKSIAGERVIPKELADQLPVAPKVHSTGKAVTLPSGVSDLHDWGTTICALPKVASEKLTYSELTSMPKHAGYLHWVLSHGQHRGGRFEDLANYLAAVGFDEKASSSCYPGTNEPREKKK